MATTLSKRLEARVEFTDDDRRITFEVDVEFNFAAWDNEASIEIDRVVLCAMWVRMPVETHKYDQLFGVHKWQRVSCGWPSPNEFPHFMKRFRQDYDECIEQALYEIREQFEDRP